MPIFTPKTQSNYRELMQKPDDSLRSSDDYNTHLNNTAGKNITGFC